MTITDAFYLTRNGFYCHCCHKIVGYTTREVETHIQSRKHGRKLKKQKRDEERMEENVTVQSEVTNSSDYENQATPKSTATHNEFADDEDWRHHTAALREIIQRTRK